MDNLWCGLRGGLELACAVSRGKGTKDVYVDTRQGCLGYVGSDSFLSRCGDIQGQNTQSGFLNDGEERQNTIP